MRRTHALLRATLVAAACWPAATAADDRKPRELLLPSAHVTPTQAKYAAGFFVLLDTSGHDLPGARFPSVSVLDGNGRELVVHDEENPPPDADLIEDAAVTPDGVLVVAATLPAGGEPVLAEYDLSRGRVLRVVRTDPVFCRAVAADAAGIWCVGSDREKASAGSHEYDVVYRFALTGERLRSFFPSSALPRRDHSWGSHTQLAYGGNRIVAWLPGEEAVLSWGPGGSNPRQVTVRVPHERMPSDLGVLADETVVMLRYIGRDADAPRSRRRALFAIDSSGDLARLPGSCDLLPMGYGLAGTDGDEIVFLDRRARRFVWLPVRCPEEE